MYSEHLSKDGINWKVSRVFFDKLKHSVVPHPQQNREDVIEALKLVVKLVERMHEVLVVFGAFILQQRLQFLYQHVGFGDVFRRALDHLGKSAEVLRPDKMQKHLGVE